MKLVVIESPYAGDVERNLIYARRCMRDSIVLHDEAPLASHLLYTQAGILDDSDPEERAWGIEAGLLWGAQAKLVAFFCDRGQSPGMKAAQLHWNELGIPTVDRFIAHPRPGEDD